ncbi:esterase FE4-like [Plutella xylostella]|uniref:esterase FE4-like n=1 Tax=Plutella xylostella TaxID=51655 RepID=UPI0020323336|nr:esterase FE4-like [Plutella xylostella]
MGLLIVLLSILLIVQHTVAIEVRVDPLVLIDQGLVRGQRALDGDYSSFLGIPYAQVDTANPFGTSLPAPKFNNVFNASDGNIACPQTSRKTSQTTLDCLRLNIFVPSKATHNNPLPVLVFIHGGTYVDGYASYDSPTGHNLVAQDIIVVSINYRLGPYGFLCLDVPEVPGNQGLKDQYMALKWVNENIAQFGGNPRDVTISGESAGAISTMFQLYADTEKLFSQVISQSGVIQIVGYFSEGDPQAAIKLAENLGFITEDTNQALEFLSNTSTDLVIGAMTNLNLRFLPCIEKEFAGVENFIPPSYAVKVPEKIRNTPILIGVNTCEWCGTGRVGPLAIENALSYFNLSDKALKDATDVLKHFYFGDEDITEETLLTLDHILSDITFVYPSELAMAKLLSEGAGPIYQYVFSFASANDRGAPGLATHAAELKYVFANGYDTFNEEEKIVSDHFTYLWSNFIKYGNPTPEVTEEIPFAWEPITTDTRPYVNIDVALTAGSRFQHEQMAFWELFYKQFVPAKQNGLF